MEVSLYLTLLLVFCHVCSSRKIVEQENSIEGRLLTLLEQFRELQEERGLEKKNANQRPDKQKEKERKRKEAVDHINAIETDKVDPKSKSLELFESMLVLQDGRKIKANDLPYDQSPFIKGLKKDDHKLSHEQKVALGIESEKMNEVDRRGGFSKRGFTNGRLWEKGIVPYIIGESLNTTDAIQTINRAIEAVSNLTCVRWVPLSEADKYGISHQAYVKFYSGGGCWSYVGRAFGGEQLLSLGGGCVHVGIALHEMLHAMGQWHEQSRTDRDQHVYFDWDVFGWGSQGGANYGKMETRDYNPYDYESIEHYWLSNGFEILQPELSFLTNFGSGLSYYDIDDITDAYRCTAGCVNPPDCKNGAFLNHKCECFCPYGLTGPTCDEVVDAHVCGGIIDLDANSDVHINSPNYPRNYDVDVKCTWLIRAPPSMHVRVQAEVLHLPYNPSNSRCYHWLEIRYNLVGQTGIKVCGDSTGNEWITSPWGEKNLMMLIFDTKYGKLHSPEIGFSLRASATSDGCIPNPCVYGVCKDCGNKDYKCECDPGFEGRNCDSIQSAATVTCSFEKGSLCFLKNAKNDDVDWKIYEGPTPSEFTGPEDAYSGDKYMYFEASTPAEDGNRAVLETNLIFPAEDRCLAFFYNMAGEHMGSLDVLSGNDKIWSMAGDQGYGWRLAQVNVSSTVDLKIKIVATRGNGWAGDIGIDEITLSPGLCEPPVEKDCYTDPIAQHYKGKVNYTKGGLACQRWDSNSPHSHSYHDYDGEENYCRNLRGDEPATWCYTTTSKRWDFCDVPHCENEMCSRSINGYDYQGDQDITIQGEKCKDNTKCRASGNDPKPWCYTVNPAIRWDPCDVPKCSTPPKECKYTGKGTEYFGTISVTESGKKCQRWDSQYPIQHNYWYLNDQENYCRNPDNSARPWCYPDDPSATSFEYCDVPFCDYSGCSSNPCVYGSTCQETENGGHVCLCKPGYTGSNCGTIIPSVDSEDCKRSAIGYEYEGLRNTTISGRTCQEWALDTPHSHRFNSLPENYCRNPDREPAPWCYTTDNSKRWEICDVPFCTTPAKECMESDKGVEYFGTVRQTRNGIPCQKWADQSPHSHGYGYISDQDDYCRNPYGHEPLPWCYTTDPDVRWDFCAVPYC